MLRAIQVFFYFLLSSIDCLADVSFEIPLNVQSRVFFDEAQDPEQSRASFSFSTTPKLGFEFDSGTSLLFEPFVRVDSEDENRTHLDLREGSVTQSWDMIEISAGIKKVFWGVTEFRNIVDIINQSDVVEEIMGKEKLGQPMVMASLFTDFGKFEGYALFGFRERVYPSNSGRPRFDPQIDTDRSTIVRDSEIDFAGRWSHQLGPIDIAVSHFIGVSREPIFALSTETGTPLLLPVYDDIIQTGLELQWIIDSLILKLEAIRRVGADVVQNDFNAVTAGFEYEFPGCIFGDCNLHWVTEYLGNDRDASATGIYQRDLFIGANLKFNNVSSTALEGGVVIDLEDATSFGSFSLDTGIFEALRLKLTSITFFNVTDEDPLKPFEFDNHFQVDLTYFFSF